MKNFLSYNFRPNEPALNALDARKKIMLRAILVVSGSLSIFLLIYVFIVAQLFPEMVTPDSENYLYIFGITILIGVFLSTILQRKGAIEPAIYVYIGMLAITIVISDDTEQILYGRSNILLLLPIVLAGVLLSSRAAYLVMSITSILSVVGWYVAIGWPGEKLPNIPAIITLIFLAFLIEWPMSFLEKAVAKLQSANKSLEESENRYRRLVNALPIGIIVHKQGLISYMNFAGAKIMAIGKPEDVIGSSVFEFVHPDDHEIVRQRIQQAASGQDVIPIEEKLIRMDGVAIDAEVSGLPIDYDGEPSTLTIFTDITERKKAQTELEKRNEQLQEVSRQLLEVQEHEKHALAVELHDDLGQSLTSLKMMLELAGELPAAGRKKAMEEASDLVYELMGKVRNLSLDLRPAMLDDFGLFLALRGLFERLHTRMQIEVHADFNLESEQRFDPRIEITAFRIIQEALTNVARYASVKEAFVSVEAGDFLRIKVEDHGQGFDLGSDSRRQVLSSGISGMQERARLVGGHMEILSEPGWGTRIAAEIPLSGEAFS